MSDLPAPPYPPLTKAKGWRFELDYEVIEQSTTWTRAKPEARPWLLMLWMISWKQVPCGSLPDDEEAIAGAIGIPDELWERHKPALLRGWWRASDGRLYHDTVSKRVFEMLEYRRKEAARRAGNRGKHQDDDRCPADVPRDTQWTPDGVPRDDARSPDTGTGTIREPSSSLRSDEGRRATRLPDDWVLPDDWAEFCRKERPDLSSAFVAECFADYWRGKPGAAGRKLDWFATWRNWVRQQRAPPGAGSTTRAADNARIIDELTGGIMSHKPKESSRATGEIIDV
ncbi:hypothetical protein [Methylibium sp.]|uniref:hypothetical protein n=1 Tax=Methylibium sp. TaxID=2067992 RepID=UPI003D0F997C